MNEWNAHCPQNKHRPFASRFFRQQHYRLGTGAFAIILETNNKNTLHHLELCGGNNMPYKVARADDNATEVSRKR